MRIQNRIFSRVQVRVQVDVKRTNERKETNEILRLLEEDCN